MNSSKKRFSIGRKMYLFVIITVLASTFGTAGISHYINANQIDEYYKTLAYATAKNFGALADKEYLSRLKETAMSDEYQELRDRAEEEDNEQLIQDYLENAGLWDGYIETRDLLMNYLTNMKNIRYLYMVACGDASAISDMYMMDDMDSPIYITGYYEVRESEFMGMDTSGNIEPTISHGDWGWLCSAYVPIYAEDGSIICHVGCDVGMDDVMQERQRNMMYILIGALVFSAVVSMGAVLFIKRIVVNPLNSVTMEMKKFTPAENVNYQQAGVVQLDIRSQDEIRDIYQEIRSMQIRIIDYLNDLSVLQKDKEKAEDAVKSTVEQLGEVSKAAYRDSLTCVGSKAAYIKKTEELDKEIQKGTAQFAIVMIDMNHLKKINDDYGHKAGDSYIKGCCQVICEIYKHSPVYRIGGDEFVVILQGADYEERLAKLEQIKKIFAESYQNTEADLWERYSASVGMAEVASDDSTVDFVFKRADRAMYEDKELFKKKYGSYR